MEKRRSVTMGGRSDCLVVGMGGSLAILQWSFGGFGGIGGFSGAAIFATGKSIACNHSSPDVVAAELSNGME